MKTIHTRNRVASFVIAILLLLPISPALAGGAHKHHGGGGDVFVTFTKWGSGANPSDSTLGFFAGIVGGDVTGTFVGEVLIKKVSANPLLTNGMVHLEAIYEVQAGTHQGNHSFTALIQGGQNLVTGAAVLDGAILAGWRLGAPVHVHYQKISSCAGNQAGPCFQGTIEIERDSED